MKVLNELEYVEGYLLKNGFSKYMSVRDLLILAKYFRYLGKEDKDIYHELISFCKVHEPTFNEIIFSNRIRFVVNQSKKFSLRLPVSVPITSKELELIREIKNYRYEKVLFTMLVLGKYYKLTKTGIGNKKREDKESFAYYLNDSIATILKLSHTSEKKEENIIHGLYILGKIDFNKKFGTYIVKIFDKENTPCVITITDMKRITDFYPLCCSSCGNPIERKGRNHRLCEVCWKEREKELWRKSKRKLRNVVEN